MISDTTTDAVANADWPDAVLDPMRQVGDELADGVIADLFQNAEVDAVNGLMRTLVTNEFVEPDSLPAIVRDYLAKTDYLPEWADPDKITAGEQVFWRYGPKIILILHSYSLPFDYLGAKGVQVLALTSRLVTNPTRRVTEVAQFLVDILQTGGLTTGGGRGRRSIQKVRLMHGAVRRLAGTSPAWRPEWDLPINQEDLAGTLMSFSWIVIDGLRKLGVELSDSDQEAYLHCWLVVGHLLGIKQELLPSSVAKGRTLAESIARRQFAPTPEGQELTRALLNMVADILPGNSLDKISPWLLQYFLGREWAEWLGVHEGWFAGELARPLRFLGFESANILGDCKALSDLAEKMGHLLIESIVYIERGGNRPSFDIPSELRQQWGVNWLS